jgi:hypothetical protein
LQRAFASHGRIRLTNQKEADALVRVHISKANIAPNGNLGGPGPRDPILKGGQAPPLPSRFRNMTVSGSYAERAALDMTLLVEIWDLRTRQKLKSIPLTAAAGVDSFRSGRSEGQFIMFEETLDLRVRDAMRSVAESVVNEFFN